MNKLPLVLIVVFLLAHSRLQSQLSGTYNIPGNYATIGAAIADLNGQGVSGPVTMLIAAGHVETAPVGGYSLYATGSAVNPITFQKNGSGANPQINAYSGGTATPASSTQDGIWKFFGSDYVTIDGISLSDPNVSNPSTMEFGFGFFKATATNGCRENTIKNCVITLRRANNAAGSGPASEGSRGIDMVNALYNAHTTSITVTNISGANSLNRFYNNLIQNCNIGIAIIGFTDVSPFTFADYDNDIGGTSSATSNTIINYGGGTSGQNAYGIKTLAQYNSNISNNYINSNNGSGLNHNGVLDGIYSGAAETADVTINSNTVSIRGSGTSFYDHGIINYAGGTGTNNIVNINGNLITNCSYTTATTGGFQAIVHAFADASTVNINYNSVTNNSCSATYYCIINGGAAQNATIHGNQASNIFFNTAPSFPRFSFIGGTASYTGTLTVSSNTVSAIQFNAGGTNVFLGIEMVATSIARINVINNVFGNLTIPTDGLISLIHQNNDCPNTLIAGNLLTGTINCTGSGNPVYGYYRQGHPTSGASTITSNYFSNVAVNDKDFYGIQNVATTNQQTVSILSNTIGPISSANGQITGISQGLGISGSINGNMISGLTGSSSITGILYNSTPTNSFTIGNNTLSAFTGAGSFSVCGYYQTGNSNADVYRNKIYDLNGTGAGSRVFGLCINSGSTTNIANNIIGNLYAPNANYWNAVNGIFVEGGSVANVFYNTVRLNASSTGSDFGSSAMFATVSPTVNLRNNILINLSSQTGTAVTVAYRRSAPGLGGYSALSNNNIFYAGTPSSSRLVFSDGTNLLSSMAAFKAFVSPSEALSSTENTSFLSAAGTSTSFLHVDPLAMSLAESNAANISGYPVDYDADIRHGYPGYTGTGLAPDIGADEFEGVFPNCTGVNTPTISVQTASICAGQVPVFNANPEPPYPGVVRQWLVASNPTGPWSPISGANGLVYTGPVLAPAQYYYRFANTCTFTSVTDTSNVVSLLVSAYPVLTLTPASSTLCTGGSPIVLSASGASSYSWSPFTGLSSNTLAVVSASPANTTTYVVTGINPGNCTSTISTVVQRYASAGGLTVSPSSATVCQGYNVNFQTISTNTAYVVTPITFSPLPTPNPVTTLCNNGVVVQWPFLGGLDDGAWQSLPIPFTFTFFEVGYTSLAIHTNGFVSLGAGLPNTLQGYNLPLPDPNAGAPCIGAVYSDLEFSYSGTINYFVTGIAPNRRFVINWVNGRYYTTSVGTGIVTTQIILYETTNDIEVHTTNCTGYWGSVEGIQNSNGTDASVVPGRNGSAFSLMGDAYRWTMLKNVTWQPSTYLTSTVGLAPVAQNIQASIVYTLTSTTGNGCFVSTTSSLSVIPSPTLSVTPVSAPVCAGTNVTLTASGAPTYTWNTGPQTATLSVAPVITTTYTAAGTGTLNSCIGYASQVVTVMPLPNVAISGPAALCKGFPQTYSVTGADTYTWSTGSNIPSFTFAAITSSVYTVTGTNTLSSCTKSAQISIVVHPNPTVSISGSSVICTGRNATLSASGANAYTWGHGPSAPNIFTTPLVTTVYSVTGFLAPISCSNTAVFTVSVNPSPTISASSATQICSGMSVDLGATGADTYTWNGVPGTNSVTVNPLSTTAYTVTGTNAVNSCTAFAKTTVTVNANPTVSIEVIPSTTICEGESVQLIAKIEGANSFSWSTTSVDTSLIVTPLTTTIYSLTALTASTGCRTDSVMEITVNSCTGIREQRADEFLVYPNPAENKLFVKNNSFSKISYELGDMNGRILLSGKLEENKNSILLDGLAKGIYYLRIKGNESRVYRIVKQ